MLNGTPCSLFLDTGSSISIVTLPTLRYLGLDPLIYPSNMVVRGVTGALSPIGLAPIHMSIGESTFTHPFVVVPGPSQLPGTMLIGHDILSSFNIWLHPHSNSVWLDGEIRPLRQHSKKWGPKPLPPASPAAHTAQCHEKRLTLDQHQTDNDSKNNDKVNSYNAIAPSAQEPHHNNVVSYDSELLLPANHERRSQISQVVTQLRTSPTPAPRTLGASPHVVTESMPQFSHPMDTAPAAPAGIISERSVITDRPQFASTLTTQRYADPSMHTSNAQQRSDALSCHDWPPQSHQPPNMREDSTTDNQLGTTIPQQMDPAPLTWHRGQSDHITVGITIDVPGLSSRWVKANANISCSGIRQTDGHILVDPLQSTHKCLFIPPALYKITGGRTEVVVINTTSKPLRLKKGTPFCLVQFTQADIVDCGVLEEHVCATMDTLTSEDHEAIDGAMTAAMESKPISNKQHVQALRDLFCKHPSILPSKSRPLGRTSLLSHSITLVDGAKPAKIPAFRIPHSRREILEKEIQGMLRADIIEESRSAWQAPLILIPKADGTLRCVADFRYLNSLTLFEPYPMQTIKSLLLDIKKDSCIFSTIDLQKGFLQVPLEESSRPYTAFSAPSGHYQFKVAALGLKNSPLTFCRLMALVLGGLMTGDLMVYVDDLLVASKSPEDHIRKLDQVFDRLAMAGLTINPAKCTFFARKLSFLGHSISDQGVAPNDEKIQAIINYPRPKTAKEVKRYLGICGYYRGFVHKYGSIAAPLTSLLKKNAKFSWDTQQQKAFTDLQQRSRPPLFSLSRTTPLPFTFIVTLLT